MTDVHEAHPELYHYTTASGLQGIVSSRQLWATNANFLNDAEEHIGFFDRRLPRIVEAAVASEVAALSADEEGKRRLVNAGGPDALKETGQALCRAFKSASLKHNNPFVVSLSAPPPEYPNEGLLSQWRAYGPDGGFAVVFDSDGMRQLMEIEAKKFDYQFLTWGDVEYYDADFNGAPRYPETVERENKLMQACRESLTPGRLLAEDAYEWITSLSVLHKHRGFKEETEVRIVALPTNQSIRTAAKDIGLVRAPDKQVQVTVRDGALVPYIELFGDQPLPIRRIVVGPHADGGRRKYAVEALLALHGVQADVNIAETPYRGR